MHRHTWRYLATLAALTALAGCAGEHTAVPHPQPLTVTNLDKARVVAVAEDVLIEMHFSIEKADADAGYVKTRPLRGGQWFEFWRSDNASARQAGHSNLHSIQRTAEITVSEIAGGLRVDCSVDVRRLSLPENDNVTMSHASAMFTSSSPTLQELRINPRQQAGMEWIQIDPDEALAARILERIGRQIAAQG
jgi:hypothetical protein